ncbi:MAG: T9SS type A sorting domain-containing protein, partial [Bacteroidota bacterium]|nr:T9SS type A sorting domain-containing protein [Bacteroidota bacterium]
VFPPFQEGGGDGGIFVKPIQAGEYVDSIHLHYVLPGGGPSCFPLFCSPPSDTVKTLIVDSYYDERIKISSQSAVTFPGYAYFSYDSTTRRYSDASIPVQFFNNKIDRVTLTEWKVLYDSSSSISFRIVQDSTPVSSILISSRSHLDNLLFEFSSTHAPIHGGSREGTFRGIIQCVANFSGIDSLYNVPIFFVFQALPLSSVDRIGSDYRSLQVFPNPSTASIKITCHSLGDRSLHLSIFNELGKDILTVHDGMLSEGKHDFSAQLPPGMYYIRMETSEGVVTKKVVVE